MTANALSTAISALWAFLNSNFWTSLAGAAAGALAGAWGAQAIAERTATTKNNLEQLRYSNAAIQTTIATVNSYAALKRQHVKKMKARFDKGERQIKRLLKNPKGGVFKFEADLGLLSAPHTPIAALRDLLFGKLNAEPRLLSMYSLLEQAVVHLSESLQQRNNLIAHLQSNPPKNDAEKANIYFGLPRPGQTDTRYKDLLEAISLQTDDCIVFGKALVEDLMDYAQRVSDALGNRSPKVFKADLSPLQKAGLLPDMREYEDVLAKTRGHEGKQIGL